MKLLPTPHQRITMRVTLNLNWYTLQVTKFDGAGPGGQFTFKYGRYPRTNPNCSNPTPVANSATQTQRQQQKVSTPVQLISP